MWSHIWNSQPSATICLLGFWGTLSKPLLRSLSGTAHGHLSFSLRYHHLEGGHLSTMRKLLTFPGCWVIYHTAVFPDLEGWWQCCRRQMGELESSCLSVMFSGHIYKAFHTFLASSMISQTPKTAYCTPHDGKESCVHTCWLDPRAAVSFSPASFHYFLCGCGQHATQFFMWSPLNFFDRHYCPFLPK